MFSFVQLEFPSFMSTLTKFHPVTGATRSIPAGENTNILIYADPNPSKFEYVSDYSYVTLTVGAYGMRLVIMNVGETVFDAVLTDFSEVKDEILKYS